MASPSLLCASYTHPLKFFLLGLSCGPADAETLLVVWLGNEVKVKVVYDL